MSLSLDPIVTPRLRLELYRLEALRRLADDQYDQSESADFPFRVEDRSQLPEASFAHHRLGLIEADPLQRPWMVRAIVRQTNNLLLGRINFHSRPPAAWLLAHAPFATELGYSIGAAYRRQGYATEALLGMLHWAHRHHGLSDIFLSVSPANVPSQRLAAKLGFRKVGEQLDEIDGLEHILRADYATVVRAAAG